MKKILNLILISALSLNIFFWAENILAKENPIESNYNFTHYFTSMEDLYKYKKSIVIDTKIWNLKAYFYWQEIWSFNASVWDNYWPTPKWRFRIVNKHEMMKAQTSWLYMPNWMEFRWNGIYWIHWFPLFSDMTPKYPNEEEFSQTPLWGWCVRIEKENINLLYNWAELLTTVIIL